MSTNSYIAVHTNEGYKTIYCHWDGYPNYMYYMLDSYYGTQERAKALVSFGDASSISKRLVPSQDSNHTFDNPEKDVCVFYHRDRDENWNSCAPKIYNYREEVRDLEYFVYIFENGEWTVYANYVRINESDFDYV